MAIAPKPVVLPRRLTGIVRSQLPATGFDRAQTFPRDNYVDTTYDANTLRPNLDVTATMRALYQTDGLVATAISSLVRLAHTDWRLEAYQTGTGEFSRDGLMVAEAVVAQMDTLHDYSSGYSDQSSLDILIEQMLLELAIISGVGTELVLDSARYPRGLQIFPYDTILWKSNGRGGRYPSQRATKVKSGKDPVVELNLPTIWVAEASRTADQIYAVPVLSSSFQRLAHYNDFIQDIWRVMRKAGPPRIVVKLDYEKVTNSAPLDVRNNNEKLQEYLDGVRENVETQLKNLNPEDALVFYDVAEPNTLSSEVTSSDYKELLDTFSGLAATALKTNPSILGLRIGGSQNVASTESMLFAHQAEGLQGPIEEVLSRALTLSVRLLGVDAYVRFKFRPVDLRPEHELEAFFAIKQNRVLELLSLGRVTDDEAQSILGLTSLPVTAPLLSGTMFYSNKQQGNLPSPNDDPNGRGMQPTTPNSSGGTDREQRP